MNQETRRACTPQQYVRKLFEETKDGKLPIRYFPFFDQEYTLTYKMNWSAEDAEALIQRYEALTASLSRIGAVYDQLNEESAVQALLSKEDQEVWKIYVCPFEPFEVDLEEVADLYFRRETDSLDEEEDELLERHYEWFIANSEQRLPKSKRTPAMMINRAQRYTELARCHAPAIILQEEGRDLAEEMVLYYYGE